MARKGGVSKTKAFRKTDIAPIEANLAAAGVERQLVGGLVAEQTDAGLFQIDTKGVDAVKRAVRTAKPLRLDEIVKPKSKVEVPAQKKLARADETAVRKKLAILASRTAKKTAPAASVAKAAAMKDAWADEAPGPVRRKLTAPVVTKVQKVRLPAGGASYNPDAAAHEQLIIEAAAQETARTERQERAKAAHAIPWAPRPDSVNYDAGTGMLYDDVFQSGDESAHEQPSFSEDTRADDAPLVMQKRRNKSEKRKDAEAAALAKAKKLAKRDAQASAQALHAKTLVRQVQAESRSTAQAAAARAKARALQHSTMTEGRKLGTMRFVRQAIEVQLPEEIAGSLRTLKPEGNLLEDRFKALQEQAKIEPRVRRTLKKRKFELKAYQKHGHKNFQ